MKKNVKGFIERNNWLKVVPNTLTVCNSLCGFAAIMITLQAYDYAKRPATVFMMGAALIISAMIFDVLDGFAARIFNAASLKGIQMDSLADMITFGVAPAVLVAVVARLYSLTKYGHWIAWGFCAIYLACAAHRLARYNVQTMVEKKSGKNFNGLPTTGAAAAICSLIFFFVKYDHGHKFIRILPVYVGILGLLMISNVKYIHFGKWLESLRKKKERVALVVFLLVCLVMYPAITVMVLVNGYVILGLLNDFRFRVF